MIEVRSGWMLFPILAFFMYFIDPVATLCLLFAIFIHEAVHCLAGITVGSYPRRLVLGYYPAVAIENPQHRGKGAWIALSAPLMNLVAFLWCGFSHHPMLSAANLVAFITALLPLPNSDLHQAFRKMKDCTNE